MNPNAPPAPPPMSPGGIEKNPYDFLSTPAPKPGLFNGGKKQRLMIVVAGGVLLLLIIGLILALVFGGAPSNKQQLLDLAKQQNELIRVAEIGVKDAHDIQAKNLALNTELSLTSDQKPLLSALKAQKVKVSTKFLASGQNSKTDQLLTAAEQSNKFDVVFIDTLQSQLTAYQKALKEAYNNPATGNKLRATLSTQYRNASLIINAKTEL